MAATDAIPVPRKNVAFRLYFAIRKNDGTIITSWTGADSKDSLDAGAFSDCTNEATEIGTSGCGYLDLTAAEMNADAVMVKITVTNTSALPLVFTLFPETAGDYRVDLVQIGGDAQSATDLKDFADAGYDPATNKVQGVVLVDTCTTNADMRGTDNAALAATALSTAVWTATIAGRIDVAVSTRLAPLVAGRDIAVAATSGAVALDSAARVKLHGTQDDYAPLKSSDYTAPLTAAATRTALGMSAADLDTQLDAILAAASASAGTGARLVTITVNDGTTVLQNAVVRLTEGGNTYRALTNVSGVATFNVDDATYSVAISKVGYSYAGTTIVVNGVETATYSMTAINVTPGSGDLTTGYLTCLDELGAAEASVAVRCQLVQVPSSGTGFAYDSTVQVETSAANGLVEFPMVKGCRYLIWRGSIKPPAGIVPVLISASAGSTTALGSLIGD